MILLHFSITCVLEIIYVYLLPLCGNNILEQLPWGVSCQLHVPRHCGSLKSAVVGIFTPWKLANPTNQSFYFSPQGSG